MFNDMIATIREDILYYMFRVRYSHSDEREAQERHEEEMQYNRSDDETPNQPAQSSSEYTDAEIQAAYDCIEGKYGNGMARGNNLQKAGFDYYRVQGLVNKILKGQFKR